ncbi:hypothetical protein ACFOYU_06125 [Microvirga sp. GCM10011540]|uniref:hypothetical protein n=1 Tax=Microvirga sp. GCM10011540 TaxID=3317338 RepID=UPI00361A9867
MSSIPRRPTPYSRRRLDLSALHEESAIADLIDEEVGQPAALDLILTPVLTCWSITRHRVLIGVDEWNAVVALDIEVLAPDLTWARTSQGVVRLATRAPLPLKPEARR